MRKTNRLYFAISLILLLVSAILSFGSNISCCFSYGYGLGDIVYIIPLWVISFIYFFLFIAFQEKFTKNGYPALIT